MAKTAWVVWKEEGLVDTDLRLELGMDTATALARGIESGNDNDMLTCTRTNSDL